MQIQALINLPILLIAGLTALITFFVLSRFRASRITHDTSETTATTAEIKESDTPPITKKEIASFKHWLNEQALPYSGMVAVKTAPDDAVSSHLGGAAALPQGMEWPLDKTGKKMLLLAQINLSEFPPVPEFPTKGILQFFIPSEDVFGMNFKHQLDSDFKVLWHPDPSLLTEIVHPEQISDDVYTPLMGKNSHTKGHKLVFGRSGSMRPSWDVWYTDDKCRPIYEKPGGEEALEEIFESYNYENHRIGGHPSFTQTDPRTDGEFRDHTRLLLQIGCDDFVMFGDSGECSFLITEADLKARRFDRVLYNWDCY